MNINGDMMKKISIKAYAVKHKLSIFNVMKMVKSGKLKSKTEEEKGKEITYILLDEKIEEEVKKGIVPISNANNTTLEIEVSKLAMEVKQLRVELDIIKKALQ